MERGGVRQGKAGGDIELSGSVGRCATDLWEKTTYTHPCPKFSGSLAWEAPGGFMVHEERRHILVHLFIFPPPTSSLSAVTAERDARSWPYRCPSETYITVQKNVPRTCALPFKAGFVGTSPSRL